LPGGSLEKYICKEYEMNWSQWNKSRLVIGIALAVIAVLFYIFARDQFSTIGLIGIFILGLISVLTARKKNGSG